MTRERPTALNVLGRGWAMHVMPDQRTRSLRYTDGRDNVRKSILILLETQPGERLMRPTFGCGLRKYIMQPNTVATRSRIQRDVETTLNRFEPRIELQSVQVTAGEDPAMVLVEIAYVHVRDRSPGNLVYPFYLE